MEQKARDKVITVLLCNSKNLHLSIGVLLVNMYLSFSLSQISEIWTRRNPRHWTQLKILPEAR